MTQQPKNIDDVSITLSNINEIYAQKQNEIIEAMEDWQYAIALNHAIDTNMVETYRHKCKDKLVLLTNSEKEVINEIRQKYRPDLLRRAIFGG